MAITRLERLRELCEAHRRPKLIILVPPTSFFRGCRPSNDHCCTERTEWTPWFPLILRLQLKYYQSDGTSSEFEGAKLFTVSLGSFPSATVDREQTASPN